MSGEPDNLTLVYLRQIDEKIDRPIDDVHDLKPGSHRSKVRSPFAPETASIRGDLAAMSLRIDGIETRLDRIERRLDLISLLAGLIFRPWPGVAGARADQYPALVLLDRMGDPADRAADKEQAERALGRQTQGGCREPRPKSTFGRCPVRRSRGVGHPVDPAAPVLPGLLCRVEQCDGAGVAVRDRAGWPMPGRVSSRARRAAISDTGSPPSESSRHNASARAEAPP